MRLRGSCLFVLTLMVLLSLAHNAYADIFASASSYAVLATTQVTNPTTNADTKIFGDMGAVSCTGFTVGCTVGPGMVSGATNLGLSNVAYTTALADSNIAYTALASTPLTVDFTGSCLGSDLGCLNNLAPGVYHTNSVANLIGALTLAGGGDPNALWIFQTAAGFVTASNSSVLVSGTSAAAGVYFEIGSQATLGDNTAFQGNILAGTAVVFNPGAQITCGRAFTDTPAGTAVTFAGNNPASSGQINEVSDTCTESSSGYNGGTIVIGPNGGPIVVPGGSTPVPEPATLLLLGTGLAGFAGVIRRKLNR